MNGSGQNKQDKVSAYDLETYSTSNPNAQGNSNKPNQSNVPSNYGDHLTHNLSHPNLLSNFHATPGFDTQSPNFMDPNWSSGLLMDANATDYLYNFDLGNPPQSGGNHIPPANPNSIMHNIQYQHNVPPPNILQEQELGQSRPSSATDNSNNESGNMEKQRRPCDQCRRRKTKCVIVPNTNNCVQCEAKQLTCTYMSQAVKRKPIDMDSTQIASEGAIKRIKQEINPNLALMQNDPSSLVLPDVAIRDVPPVQDYSQMNNSLLKKTLSLQFPRSSYYVGPTSYLYDAHLLNLIMDAQSAQQQQQPQSSNDYIEQVNLNTHVSLRKVSNKVLFVLKDDQSPQSYQSMSKDVDTIEKLVSPHGQILIDLYFRIVHPSYPIIHKKVFLEKYSRTHREFSGPLLASVYALAIQWWDYDPQLNRFPKPNVEMILKIAYNNYLAEILKRPKLSAVQAGLLLLQCKHIINSNAVNAQGQRTPNQQSAPTNSDVDYSEWVLCCQVVSLAEELGLGLDCRSWKLPKWERGLRKRLAWAVYMEDKWLSLKFSRPSHITEQNWVVESLRDEDFPEKHGDGDLKEGSNDIDNGKMIFMNFIELSKILSEMIDQFYTMKAMIDIKDVNTVLKLAKPLQLKLRNWYHSLPIELQMSSVQPRKLCANGYLQLAYFAAELTLHRKITTIILEQTKAGIQPPMELINVCRSAAKTRLMASIEFVRDLKPEHIHSFWHLSSTANFTLIGTFASILFMSAPTKDEADFYRDQIFNYRWNLKIISKGFDQAADALAQMDMVISHIPGLLSDNVNLPIMAANVPDQPPRSPQQQLPPTHQSLQSQFQRPASTASLTSTYVTSIPKASPNMFNNGKLSPQQRMMMPNQMRGGGGGAGSGGNNASISESVGGQSPYNSPQNMYTPAGRHESVHSPHASQASRNSPMQSQHFSPKENIKRPMPSSRHSSIAQERNLHSPGNSRTPKGDSPSMMRSPHATSAQGN